MKKLFTSVIAAVAVIAIAAVQADGQIKSDKKPAGGLGDLTTPVKGPNAAQSVPLPKEDRRRRAAMTRENLARQTTVVSLTNQFREQQGKPRLKEATALDKVAQSYAALMAIKDQSGHGVDGKDGGRRLDDAGYAWTSVKENVGWNVGQKDPAGWIIEKWENSTAGHRENMLSTEVTEFGVGVATSSTGKIYFCELFAKPR